MLSFLLNIIGFILTGLVGSIILILLLVFVIKLLYPGVFITLSPVSILLLVCLFIFLFAQLFLFSGAVYARKQAGKMEKEVTGLIEISKMNKNRIDRIRAEVEDEYPFLGKYVQRISDKDLTVFIKEPGKYVRSIINVYIWKRVGWIAGGLLLAGYVLFYRTADKQRRSDYMRNRKIMNL